MTLQEKLRQEKLRQEKLRQEKLRQEKLRQEKLRQEQLRQEQLKKEQLKKEKFKKIESSQKDDNQNKYISLKIDTPKRSIPSKFIIKKQNTTDAGSSYTEDTGSSYVGDTVSQTENDYPFLSIVDSNYKKPITGTRQENYTRDDILKQLQNYIPLKTIQDKKILEGLPIFKTWIRYYNTTSKLFRTGGLLMKVVYPDYIMLVNTSRNITWSVQLKDNIIYIPNNAIVKQKEKEDKNKETLIKNKLYEMYKNGKLAKK
jgi:hypothetical protein